MLNSKPPRITGRFHHQITRVLRTNPGDKIKAVCGDGFEYLIEIGEITGDSVSFEILDRTKKDKELNFHLSVYPGILKSGKMEQLLAPMVYLGVNRVVPVITKRSVARTKKFHSGKIERFQKIIQRATALSGRTRLMQMDHPVAFQKALQSASESDFLLLFWEGAKVRSLEKALGDSNLSKSDSVSVFFGPEGGFDEDEIRRARKAGVITLSLGSRILDAVIAPTVGISALLCMRGEL